jgi:hypothetical protein
LEDLNIDTKAFTNSPVTEHVETHLVRGEKKGGETRGGGEEEGERGEGGEGGGRGGRQGRRERGAIEVYVFAR